MGVGKSCQVHKGMIGGAPKAVRFLLPSARALADWEKEALLRIAGPLSAVMFPEASDRDKAAANARQVLRFKYDGVVAEMDFHRTVQQQNRAKQILERTETVHVDGVGEVIINYRVPQADVRVEHGDEVMVYDWVDGMTTEELVQKHPQLAKGLALRVTEHTYEHAIFEPVIRNGRADRRGRKSSGRDEILKGVANADPHAGNFFWAVRSNGSALEVDCYMMDWGIMSEMSPSQNRHILS